MPGDAISAMDNKDGPFAECHELIAEMRRIYRCAPKSLNPLSRAVFWSKPNWVPLPSQAALCSSPLCYTECPPSKASEVGA